MSSNSTLNLTTTVQASSCNNEAAYFVIDKFETPIYLVVGVFSRLLSLASIYRESKIVKAYFYQIYLLIAEAMEILIYFIMQLTRSLTISSRTNALWFQRCYACMWYSTHLSTTLVTASKTSTGLLTLAMTLDRVYAISRPNEYVHLPHATIRRVVLFVTVLVSIPMGLPASFFSELVVDANGLYVAIVDFAKLGFTFTLIYQLSVAFDLALLTANVLTGLLLCHKFRKAMKVRATIPTMNENANFDDQWRTLFKMTFCQSLCNTLGLLSENAIRLIASYAVADTGIFHYVVICVQAPFTDALVMLLDIVEFCLIMILSKKFRSMVTGTVRRMMGCQKTNKTQVRTVQVTNEAKQVGSIPEADLTMHNR